MARDIRQFAQQTLSATFTREQVLDIVFYSFFNLEQSLAESFKLKLQHMKFLDQLFEKEMQKKKQLNTDQRRRFARAGREGLMFGIGVGDPTSGFNLGQFIDSVRIHMQKSKQIHEYVELMGLDRKSRLT